MHPLDHIQRLCLEQCAALYPSVDLSKAVLTLNADPARASFGDLSFNAPLIIAAAACERPRDVAARIKEGIHDRYIDSIEIAGPGFLNIRLTPDAYQEICTALATDHRATLTPHKKSHHSYSLEYVSANPTGPLHIGHGRGGIIGDTLARILVFVGQQVNREFYSNDAGAQIGKLGESLRIRYIQALGGEAELPEDGYHGEYLKILADQCIALYGPTLIENRLLSLLIMPKMPSYRRSKKHFPTMVLILIRGFQNKNCIPMDQ